MKGFVDFLFDNDRKVASSYKRTQIKVGVQKPYPSYDQDSQNQLKYPIYDQNKLKNHTL